MAGSFKTSQERIPLTCLMQAEKNSPNKLDSPFLALCLPLRGKFENKLDFRGQF
jgi:hypothetical protein